MELGDEILFENERPVPSVEFDFGSLDPQSVEERIEQARREAEDETLRTIFRILIQPGFNALDTGIIAHAIAMEAGFHPAHPESQRELATAIGVTQSAVSKRITSQMEQSPDFKGVFESLKAKQESK